MVFLHHLWMALVLLPPCGYCESCSVAFTANLHSGGCYVCSMWPLIPDPQWESGGAPGALWRQEPETCPLVLKQKGRCGLRSQADSSNCVQEWGPSPLRASGAAQEQPCAARSLPLLHSGSLLACPM